MSEIVNYKESAGSPEKINVEQPHTALIAANINQRLGIALVGLGHYSTEQLAPALLETKFCRLAGLVTDDPSKVPDWKNKYGIIDAHIYNYENFENIANDKDIDIVYIALPNVLHTEYVIRAAKAGKHVICEKPMATTVAECDQMIEACKKAGKLLSIGYRLHYDPCHREIMKMGQEKIFGKINYIHAQHGTSNTGGWRFNKKMAGGGALMDLGIYCIQAARYITGEEPVAVKVCSTNSGEIEEFLSWEMEFPGGVIAKSETSYINEMNLVHAKAEHGWFELSPAYSYKGVVGKTATGFLNFPSVNQQALQMDDFAFSIMAGKPVRLPGEMGRQDIRIIEAIYESMKTGKRVVIGEPEAVSIY